MNFLNVHDLTVIITASHIKSHPSTKLIDKVINSLNLINLPQNTPIILAHDYNNNKQYLEYLQNLKRKYSYNKNIIINLRNTKGHLTGNIRDAFKLVKTKFVLILQHDLPFIKKLDIKKVMEDMNKNNLLKHIRFNKRKNIKSGFDSINNIFNLIKINNNYSYISTPGWSDQNHLTYTDYYKNIVLKECKDGSFMENYLQGKITNLSKHKKYGTFLFGEFNEEKYIQDLDGRNNF